MHSVIVQGYLSFAVIRVLLSSMPFELCVGEKLPSMQVPIGNAESYWSHPERNIVPAMCCSIKQAPLFLVVPFYFNFNFFTFSFSVFIARTA